ncbi:hypothetical protein GCM10017653_47330 [Ancylobacter defluvii]|uniref:Uncharacterized protein n=2 Tax=Ancylobacter defluvii TaxID=1282440 RepID=A0A9W6K458_9HYPH|nr:hypothetical protein GCM10017653_47330 [Ancylobacter defluvii]
MSRSWPRHRLVHLGYLAGIGCTGPQITAALGLARVQAVSNTLRRYGVKLHRRRDGRLVQAVAFSRRALDVIDEAAAQRGISRDEMIQKVIEVFGAEESSEDALDLIANLLDDGGEQ